MPMTQSTKKEVILIVEDVRADRLLLRKILTARGYEILEAADGDHALLILTQEIPDLILLDILMPGMNGFEVCGEIKKNPRTAHIPVIFTTSVENIEGKIRGFHVGGADYVTKPFHSEEILARVRLHLDLKKALEKSRTSWERAEEMLEQRTKQLIWSEKHAAFGQLVQGIVHNMRNPLSTILGYSHMSQANLNKAITTFESAPREARTHLRTLSEHLEQISLATRRLTEMMNSMLGKIRTDHKEKLQYIDLNTVIHQELTFFEADMIFCHRIEKEIQLHPEPLAANAVPSMIAQVFENLVQNAMDAMHDSPAPLLTIKSGKEKDFAWFSISDNGHGIEEENLSRIFDPFFTTKSQSDTGENREPRGTGLGLYICQDMINFHRGRIEVKSVYEKGTTFTVYIPAAKAESGIADAQTHKTAV